MAMLKIEYNQSNPHGSYHSHIPPCSLGLAGMLFPITLKDLFCHKVFSLLFITHSLCASQCAKYFAYSLYLLKSGEVRMGLFFTFYKGENGTERSD